MHLLVTQPGQIADGDEAVDLGQTHADLLGATSAEVDREPRGEAPPAEPEGQIDRQYPTDTLPGHAAWIDSGYKLHRVPVKKNKGEFAYELYHLGNDPKEQQNLLGGKKLAKRVDRMKAGLAAWQKSVVNSLNGGDYR